MKYKKQLANFGIYFFTSIGNTALPFFLLPILTRYLSPVEYGILAIFQVLISFCTPLIGMGMHVNITRNFFKKDQEVIARLISNLLFVMLANTTIILLLGFLYLNYFYTNLSGDIWDKWVYSIPVIAAMATISQFNLTILRNQRRALLYGTFEILNTALNLGLTLLLVVIYGFGWEGRAVGIFGAFTIVGCISLIRIYMSGFLTFDITRQQIKEILIISFPLILHLLSSVIINLSDRFFINAMLGVGVVGIYAVGYQFGMIILLVTDTFNKVWSPWMYERLSNITLAKKRGIVRITYLYNVGIIALALGLTFVSYFLLRIMTTPAYYGAQEFIIWLMLGYAVRGMYTMVFPYLVFVGKTSFLGIITSIAAVLNLLANYVLIKLNGAVGAAQATLLSFIVMYLGVWWYANRIYPMPWRYPFERSASEM